MIITLSSFFNSIKRGSRNTVKMNNYLFSLLTGTYNLIELNNKFVHDPIPSSGLDYINSMLIRVDMDYLLKFKNDIERYGKIEKMMSTNSFSDFIYKDAVQESGFVKPTFYDTIEYYIPITDIDSITTFPMGSDNINDWMAMRPFRMIENQTTELSMDNLATRFKYSKNQPFSTVFTLNVPLLLLLYTKYCLLEQDKEGESINRYPFIYTSCVRPLLYDSCRAWMMTIYSAMVTNTLLTNDPLDGIEYIINNRGSYARVGIKKALVEIKDLLIKCRTGAISPDVILNSISIRYGYSLADEIPYIRDNNFVKGGLQYYWLTFLKDIYLLKLIIGIYSISPGNSRSKQLFKLVEVVLRRLQNAKFWNHAPDPNTKELIKFNFTELTFMI